MTLTVIGDAFIDIIVPVDCLQDGYTYYRTIKTTCGGTANVAIQASRLGNKVKFVGKVGNDPWGKYFKETLQSEKVIDFTFVDSKYKTGLCISFVYNNDRSMVADRGANDNLTIEEIQQHIDEIVTSKIVYFSGYSLVSNNVGIVFKYLLKECKKNNCIIVFNPGAPNIIKPFFKDLIKNYVDCLVLNLDEAKMLSGRNNIDDIIYSLNKLVYEGVITMGAKGCVLFGRENKDFVSSEKIIERTDTTGAGDAFSAGFLSGKVNNLDNITSAIMGNKTALQFLINKMSI